MNVIQFVDFAGRTIPVVDPTTGEVRQAQLFIAVLGSNYMYAEACWTCNICSWIAAHVRTFQFLGGVPEIIIVPDTSTVVNSYPIAPNLRDQYHLMACHYRTSIICAPAKTTAGKSKIFKGVQIAEKWILAALQKKSFYSLAELNSTIAQLVDKFNTRPCKAVPKTWFKSIERPALNALPQTEFKLKKPTPPKSRQRLNNWTPERIINWAKKIGLATNNLVHLILKNSNYSKAGLHACLGLLSLHNEFGDERLEAACARALTFPRCSVSKIRALLKSNLDKQITQLPIPNLHVRLPYPSNQMDDDLPG